MAQVLAQKLGDDMTDDDGYNTNGMMNGKNGELFNLDRNILGVCVNENNNLVETEDNDDGIESPSTCNDCILRISNELQQLVNTILAAPGPLDLGNGLELSEEIIDLSSLCEFLGTQDPIELTQINIEGIISLVLNNADPILQTQFEMELRDLISCLVDLNELIVVEANL
jgi:hypothetical protein